jgi:phosphoribosylformylglycinamidine synthase
MKATIYISLKNGVLDPQGKAIENALGQLGFNGVDNVRQGKMIELDLADTGRERSPQPAARNVRKAACQYGDRKFRHSP